MSNKIGFAIIGSIIGAIVSGFLYWIGIAVVQVIKAMYQIAQTNGQLNWPLCGLLLLCMVAGAVAGIKLADGY